MLNRAKVKRLMVIALALLMLQAGGCKTSQTATEVPQTNAPVKETEASSEVVVTATDETNWTGFASISNFSDRIDEATNQLDEAADDVDSFAVMGDMLLMFQLGIMINDAGLEHALNGSQDTYVSDVNEAPNGSGTYTSSITLDNGRYFFGYDFEYKDGGSYYIKLAYSPADKTITAERSHSDGTITQANYVVNNEGLFISYGDSRKDNLKTNKMLICQIGNNVYYAAQVIDEYISEPLPVDILGGLETLPTDWDSFVENFDYQRMLKVEDGKIEFIEE